MSKFLESHKINTYTSFRVDTYRIILTTFTYIHNRPPLNNEITNISFILYDFYYFSFISSFIRFVFLIILTLLYILFLTSLILLETVGYFIPFPSVFILYNIYIFLLSVSTLSVMVFIEIRFF